MRQYGINGKKRFSLKYPDGRIRRYGTHDPKDDERKDLRIEDGIAYLVHYDLDSYKVERFKDALPDGTLATNGYYDYEHDGWTTIEEFINQ